MRFEKIGVSTSGTTKNVNETLLPGGCPHPTFIESPFILVGVKYD